MGAIQTNEKRFNFGKNWSNYLSTLNEDRIIEAEKSLIQKLGISDLTGKTFLDIGSGSGLFSLSARRLGAKVYSFDYDIQSVECTKVLKDRFYPNDANWLVQQGNVLDKEYMIGLGKFDIVYSWGVLHHTGKMWDALDIVDASLENEGLLYISIYNNQGLRSKIWLKLKKIYNELPNFLKLPYTIVIMGTRELMSLGMHVVTLRPMQYVKSWTEYYKSRGMSRWHDIVDWIGGYPFEVAKPEEIFKFFHQKGYELVDLKTCAGGLGCNEFVFRKHINTDNNKKESICVGS